MSTSGAGSEEKPWRRYETHCAIAGKSNKDVYLYIWQEYAIFTEMLMFIHFIHGFYYNIKILYKYFMVFEFVNMCLHMFTYMCVHVCVCIYKIIVTFH